MGVHTASGPQPGSKWQKKKKRKINVFYPLQVDTCREKKNEMALSLVIKIRMLKALKFPGSKCESHTVTVEVSRAI